MKFANIIHNGLGIGQEKRIVNLGDSFEILAIEQLYKKMRIAKEDIVYIDFYEMRDYDGDYVILPINFQIELDLFGKDMLQISDRIVPVFLGLSLPNVKLEERHVQYLKKFQPIGCRDERTMRALREYGCDAYVGGCIVATLDRPKIEQDNSKVFFISAPKGIKEYVPWGIWEKAEFVEHEYWLDYEQMCRDPGALDFARQRIVKYAREASMIVTSRFHGALIAIALNIPFILAMENNFYKYSWLSGINRLYERSEYSEIDWNPVALECTYMKECMEKVAIRRIKEAYEKYEQIYALSTLLENVKRNDGKNLLYYYDACQYVEEHWDEQKEICYAIWGVSENAEHIYWFLKEKYPKAVLVEVYDGLQKLDFHGIEAKVPAEDNISEDVFVFVTSNTACKSAQELFSKVGKKNYFLCKLDFMNETDKVERVQDEVEKKGQRV